MVAEMESSSFSSHLPYNIILQREGVLPPSQLLRQEVHGGLSKVLGLAHSCHCQGEAAAPAEAHEWVSQTRDGLCHQRSQGKGNMHGV